jgi:hypothetical protein
VRPGFHPPSATSSIVILDGHSRAGRQERLDGDDEPFSQQRAVPRVKGVRDLRLFVDVSADPVSAEIANDPQATSPRAAFDGTSDVVHGSTCARLRHGVFQRKTRRTQQRARLSGHRPHREAGAVSAQ